VAGGSPQANPDRQASTRRRAYLDWLRGLAVLVMIEGHTFDAWTRPADRSQTAYDWIVLIAGAGGPLFLFLAGVSVAFAATARTARLGSEAAAARTVRSRGWQIFLYAFLFRLQSFVLSGSSDPSMLLKVDILNVMGLSIVASAMLWRSAGALPGRVIVLTGATVAIAMVTPVLRHAAFVDALPDPVEWYFHPVRGRTNFTLFPWSGFVTAGAAVGLVLQRKQDRRSEQRIISGIAVMGLLVSTGGYAASYLPSFYSHSDFWTSSPTFFFLRVGVLMVALSLAWMWEQRPWSTRRWSPLVLFGVESLFVYWIHVELVYGLLSTPLHRALPLPWVVVAFVTFTVLMLGVVALKRRLQTRWQTRRRPGSGAAAADGPVSAANSRGTST
jgi:uncharacterized membrane protein